VADQAAQALHDRRALTVTLIVVSGAPGTGKSTIAAALGAVLRFPVLSLDPIKEVLADVLGLVARAAPGPRAGRVRSRDGGVLPLRPPAGFGPGQGPDRPRPASHSP
jgi:chloramphenicol 3-O-phosphotransferase